MKLGPLEFGWIKLNECERILLDLDPWPAGWEAFSIEWRGRGLMLCVRPKRAKRGANG